MNNNLFTTSMTLVDILFPSPLGELICQILSPKTLIITGSGGQFASENIFRTFLRELFELKCLVEGLFKPCVANSFKFDRTSAKFI